MAVNVDVAVAVAVAGVISVDHDHDHDHDHQPSLPLIARLDLGKTLVSVSDSCALLDRELEEQAEARLCHALGLVGGRWGVAFENPWYGAAQRTEA